MHSSISCSRDTAAIDFPTPRSLHMDWYDYPQYFDMLFRDETALEVSFFEQALARYVAPHGGGPNSARFTRLLEPGCGSGRLVVAMAARGYDVTGIDLSGPALRYLRNKLRRRGLRATLHQLDFTDFQLDHPFDAAFCTFNTFRHLTTESAAVRHLQSVARHLRPGGIYILGFHILPLDAEETCTERWVARHSGTKVHATLRVVDFDRRKRIERLRVVLTVTRAASRSTGRNEFPLRIYTLAQALKTIRSVKELEIVSVFDFDYDLDRPRRLDDDLTDAVFVLRKLR